MYIKVLNILPNCCKDLLFFIKLILSIYYVLIVTDVIY